MCKHLRMGKALELTNQRFGRLVAVRYVDSVQNRRRWLCRCDCGNEPIVYASSLSLGDTRSCGCLKLDRAREWAPTLHALNVKTGYSRHPTYQSWRAMKRRCSDPSHRDYAIYGGRGIQVCERWQKFENFFADMGIRPDGRTLDRIDANKGYEPGNCRWATPSQQQNNMRSNRILTLHGRSHTVSEWSRILKMTKATIAYRLSADWPTEAVLTKGNFRNKRRPGT